MLLAIGAHSERHQIVDQSAVEAQDHVGVDLVNLVLIVAHNVVKAAVIVDFRLYGDAVLDILKLLVHYVHVLVVVFSAVRVGWACLLLLFVGSGVVLLEIVPFDRLLKDLYDLLPSVLLEAWVVLAHLAPLGHLPSLIVELLVHLRQVLVLASRNSNHLLIPIRIAEGLISKEDVEGAVLKDHDELVGVLPFDHGLKPAHMDHLPLLFDLRAIIVLEDHASVLQLRIVAAYSTAISAQEQLNLGLVPAFDLVVVLLSLSFRSR